MTPPSLTANPFFASAEQRLALARRRFFEDGVRPSGMVSEAVIQSWSRCLRAHPDPAKPAVFEPVTPSRVDSALRRNRELLAAAHDELARLRVTLAGTSSTAMLTDAQGVIIGSTFTRSRSHERLMPVTTRLGVNLAEEAVGTTAPGITARSGQASVVLGCEHFFGNVQTMQCAAAPIRDVRGQLAGVLDLSSEGVAFGFDAASVVAHYAAEIENRLLCAQSTEHLVVRLQITPMLLDTPMVALLGIAGDGRIDWMNGAAARLLGLPAVAGPHEALRAEDSLGLPLEALLAMSARDEAQSLHLPNGLTLWMRCEWRSRDRHRALHAAAVPAEPPRPAPEPAPAPPAATDAGRVTLRQTERETIARVLADCGGNVSRAARTLGVSRGLIYRHLRPPTE
jgi:sigma-54 dependent transcriptional regulator, acetoin dehydrogenase operon transcriptional activator AcoR